MGKSYVVKYFKKISDTAFEPLAHDARSLGLELHYRDLAWCDTCQAAVEPEGYLDVRGIGEKTFVKLRDHLIVKSGSKMSSSKKKKS